MLDIAVTNRQLCKDDFLAMVKNALARRPFALLLREKDLSREAYLALACKVNDLCIAHAVPLIPHTYAVPGVPRLHLPFPLADAQLAREYTLSVSVHSAEEARMAESIGAAFVIYGHVFATQCKPGLEPRGITRLREVCESVRLPVFAIGGITEQNARQCIDAGAAGVCRMSYWMQHI